MGPRQSYESISRLGPSMTKRRRIAILLLAGLWFALLQASFLFLLQTYFSASFQSYLLLVTAWIAGALAGVWITLPWTAWLWLSSCFSSAALTTIWLSQLALPLELTWCLLFLCALPAGNLFRSQVGEWKNSGEMFFWEALGFTVGLPLATGLLMKLGTVFCKLSILPGVILFFLSFKRGEPDGAD